MKTKFLKTGALLIAVASILGACNKKDYSGKGINIANMDTTVSPGTDFFLYANGGWLKNNPIPASESRWGSFNEIQDNNFKNLKTLLDELSNAKSEKGSNNQKVGDFYASGMDSITIENAGTAGLSKLIEEINSISDASSLVKTMGKFQVYGIGTGFTFYAYQDPKNSASVVPQAMQGGLGLPDRDYYFSTDPRSVNIRNEYPKTISKFFELRGENAKTAMAKANAVVKLETSLAKACMKREEMRDPNKIYHKMTIAELNKLTPNINWNDLMTSMNVNAPEYLIIGQPDFFVALNKEIKSTSISDWKAYFEWHTLKSNAAYLNSAYVNENFKFYGTTLRGVKELKPRWKRVLQTVDGNIGEALGDSYVKRYFSEDAKKKCLEMVNNLQIVFKERIQGLDWMTDSTKQKANVKLDKFIKKIGYPDKFKDYSNLEISRDSYVGNVIASNIFGFNEMINKIGKPVDKMEWLMTPPTVNAYYNPSTNEIAFPAGILQKPFFDPEADDAVNYGAIGSVIGHEMTHGFDDEGSQFDADGNLKVWWSEADRKNFESKTMGVVEQFNNYKVLDSIAVNGKLTLGENIADLGGLSISYAAFKRTEQGKGNEKIDGLTPDQRFFIGWAQGWRANTRDEEIATRIITDPHSPNKFRANGPVSNMTEFYTAFNVKEGDPMYRSESIRAKVW